MTKLDVVRASANLIDGSAADADLVLDADVVVVGSGAGGAVAAATLAEAGARVVVVEEGGHYGHRDFDMRETSAYRHLYQDAAQRMTADFGISILQGKAVGGTTVVNWTTCFRTPEDVVDLWASRHAVRGFAHADLVPHWEAIEDRLAIAKVPESAMNENNRRFFVGCRAAGFEVETTRRNVHGCMQSGYCGMGCPVDAKRSMLVTKIPDAIDAGARVLFRARVDALEVRAGAVVGASATLLDATGRRPTGRRATLRARRWIVSGGAINSPALLLRSGLDDGVVGRRTFLHPVIGSIAEHDEPVRAFSGAPQSAASHAFSHRGDEVGFFLEAAPGYPALGAAIAPGFGDEHASRVPFFDRISLALAIAIDGFHDDVPGGIVRVGASGAPLLDYPIPDKVFRAFRFAQKRLAELQLAGGARRVFTLHDPAVVVERRSDVERAIDAAPYRTSSLGVFSAHVMGGCAMGDDPSRAVVRSHDLRHHRVENLWVMDGSVFPTSLGVNPQESIYGLVGLMATRLARG